ncbi:MAG: EipB family protein [Rhizobiaceae bacterium]
MIKFSGALLISMTMTLPAAATGFEILAPHRAIYEVKLENAEERSGIEGMDGRIVYELRGNECEGIAINYRFVTRINTGREQFVTDQQSASYESPDGNEFSFSTKSFVNEQPDQTIKGSAVRQKGGLVVSHDGTNPRKLELENGLFTSSHLIEVMKRAQDGETFISHSVFDGSGEADKVLNSASVIGKPRVVAKLLEGEVEDGIKVLKKKEAWRITMSYFNANADNTAEALPIYEASFLLYRNGVTRDLTMRYPDYALKASLINIEYFDQTPCELEN